MPDEQTFTTTLERLAQHRQRLELADQEAQAEARRTAMPVRALLTAQQQAKALKRLDIQLGLSVPDVHTLLNTGDCTLWQDRRRQPVAFIQGRPAAGSALPTTLLFRAGRTRAEQLVRDDAARQRLSAVMLGNVRDLELAPHRAPERRDLVALGFTRLPGTLREWERLNDTSVRLRRGVRLDDAFVTLLLMSEGLALIFGLLIGAATHHILIAIPAGVLIVLALFVVTDACTGYPGTQWIDLETLRTNRQKFAALLSRLSVPEDPEQHPDPAAPASPLTPTDPRF